MPRITNVVIKFTLSVSAALLLLSLAAPHSTRSSSTPLSAQQQQQPLSSIPYTPSLDLASLDRTADACVDFYQFVCGGWMKNNPIPADQPGWSVYAKLENENQQYLWGILQQNSDPSAHRTPNEQKIGDYFEACMNEDQIEKTGYRPMQQYLSVIDALTDKSMLPYILATQHLALGNNSLFSFNAHQDLADSSQVIAFALAGGLGLPDRDYYTEADPKLKEIRDKYVIHIAKTLQLIGEPASDATRDAQTILHIETALAEKSLTPVQQRDPYNLFHKMDRAQLQALTPNFNWNDYLTAMGIANVQNFNVTEPEFYKELNSLLQTISLDDLKTYLRWHLARSWSPYLSKNFQDEDFNFYSRTLRGVNEMKPRWQRCIGWIDRDLGEALGQVFVDKTFTPETKARTLKMTQNIEAAMETDLKELPWMTADTKKEALAKLYAIVNKIGYPDKWRNYGALDIHRDEFGFNVARSAMFESRRQLNKIGQPLDRGEWTMTPITVDAEFDPQMNDINFPAGVLQPPLFDPKMDDAPNYGNTGGTIGHELTHCFDDEGRQFDSHGNLRDWWTKKDAEGFEERLACIQKQYAQYVVVDDIHINSKLTSGEDVADLGGLLLAYIAWKNAIKADDLKPVDGFTPDQRFFIGYGQWACENMRPEELRLENRTNPHSPGKYRIDGTVSDMPQFAAAFHCHAGQPMVRPKQCRIW
jgi:endothelin-converting enzyme/putative endopeptidase